MVNLVLEYDDLHFMEPENCLDTVDRFVSLCPDIKISFFTIPYLRGLPLSMDQEWCSRIRSYIDSENIVLARHGFHHTPEEFKHYGYDQAITALSMGDSIFTDADLPTVNVFRGPHWGLCEDSVKALIDKGYTHLYNHEDYKDLGNAFKKNIKVRYYNWNLAEDPPEQTGVGKLVSAITSKPTITHGHTHDVCGNGISQTFDRVCSFIESNDVDFKFVHEV